MDGHSEQKWLLGPGQNGDLEDQPGSQKQTSREIRPGGSILSVLYAIETISGAATNPRRIGR